MPTLHGLEPEQLARIGIFYLEEAVLDVLHEARHGDDEWLLPADISRMMGITVSEYVTVDYPLVHGTLDELCRKNQVEHDGSAKRKWRLTDEEFENRCDDL